MGSFISELRRRKVLRVAVAYVVSSWVLLQVAELLASVLELPSWAAKLVLVILIIGFVPALILAWAYDLTPDGIKVTPADDDVDAERPRKGNTALIVVSALFVVAAIAVGGVWYSGKDARWARDVAMFEIEAFIGDGDTEAAFQLARRVESVLPGDPEMVQIWNSFAWTTSIVSTPAGAKVYRRPYSDPDTEWLELGTTPLYDIRIPHGASLLRFEAEGHAPLLRVLGGGLITTTELRVIDPPETVLNVNPEKYQLYPEGTIPDGMVRVPGWEALMDGQIVAFNEFFLGRYEVTNREYQTFVDADGYGRRDLWEHEFVDDGGVLSFEEAMALFVDRTARPGPSTWEAGAYPEGDGDLPVTGVSWYEAAAYARFAGFELPSIHHWRRAMAIGTLAWQLPASNLNGDAIAPVGTFGGIGWTGTYDMAGNAREWCFNPAGDEHQRTIVGSAWADDPYLVEASMDIPHRVASLDRSASNGFRLAATRDDAALASRSRKPPAKLEVPEMPEPVSDEVFAANLSDFDYDHSPLNPVLEEIEEFRHWTRQRVTIDVPGSAERMSVYVYLPKNESTRHQAVTYWGGATGQLVDSGDKERFRLGFLLRSGRAVVLPALKGTYERRLTPRPDWTTHNGRNLAIEEVREFRRVIDYLETRPDIDMDKLAYYGHSWGGRVGAQILAVEPRIKVGILNQAGFYHGIHPDISAVNFLPRVKVPVLHFSGLYDTDFRYETSSKPFHELLGTSETDKKHVVEPTGHFVPFDVVAGETLDWLDRYLGPPD
jgi:formylglycine-generating enzyme required for sulfatase activity/dienelactone hydrolase